MKLGVNNPTNDQRGDALLELNGSNVLSVVTASLALYALYFFRQLLAHSNPDQTQWFLPWLKHILYFGRFESLKASFASYNPPYIYALIVASLFSGVLSPLTVVKLTNAPFLIFAMGLTGAACRRMGCTWPRALTGGLLVLVAPETLANALSWGQCDIMYSSFLLCFLVAVMFRRPALSMISFGLAISFKLQAIFLGPVVLMLLITEGLPLWTIALIPLTYLTLLVPALIAGRPATSLFSIYGAQYNYFNDMAYSVANPYRVIMHPASAWGLIETVKKVGLILSLCCNVAFLRYLWLRRSILRMYSGVVILAAMSLILEVFTLPKMHERYYFPANLLLLTLVAVSPRRFCIPAILLQCISVITYGPFLYETHQGPVQIILGAAGVALVWFLLYREVEKLHSESLARGRLRQNAVLPDGRPARAAVTS